MFVISWFGFSFALVAYNVAQATFRQQLCPPRLLGRMNATMRFLTWGVMPVGALLGGSLGEVIGVRPTLWVIQIASDAPATRRTSSPRSTARRRAPSRAASTRAKMSYVRRPSTRSNGRLIA
jgi:hypothetical protein